MYSSTVVTLTDSPPPRVCNGLLHGIFCSSAQTSSCCLCCCVVELSYQRSLSLTKKQHHYGTQYSEFCFLRQVTTPWNTIIIVSKGFKGGVLTVLNGPPQFTSRTFPTPSLDELFQEGAVEVVADGVVDEPLLVLWLIPRLVAEHDVVVPPPLDLR